MSKINELISRFYILIIVAISLVGIWALFVPGYFGASDDLHVAWLYEMSYLMQTFQIPPRFVPDLSFGFGYPLYNFVFPLPYYMAGVVHQVGFNLVDSVKIIFGLTIPVSMVGMYWLGRRLTQPLTALGMSILYGLAPYRALDLYIRGAFGEIVALMFLPFLVWVLLGVVDDKYPLKKKIRFVFGGGLLITGSVLAHNITAYMFFPWLVILSFLLIFHSKNRLNFLYVGLMFALGAVGSSYFWVPAIFESNLMKYDTVFNYIDHFPTIRQLVTPYWGYGASVPGPYDGMSFFLGYSNLAAIVGVFLFGFTQKKNYTKVTILVLGWVVVMLCGASFMMNFRSSFLWELIPMIAQFQFPWRFLILMSFGIPLLLVGVGSGKVAQLFVMFLMAITIVFNFGYFRPQDFLGRNDEYFMSKYLVYPKVDPLYLTQSEEYLRLPVATEKRPEQVYPDIFDFEGKVTTVNTANRLMIDVKLESNKTQQISLNKYLFPGWRATIDGSDAKLLVGKPFGQVSIVVPAGIHNFRVWFGESSFRLIFDGLSLVGIITMIIGLGVTSLNIKKGLK